MNAKRGVRNQHLNLLIALASGLSLFCVLASWSWIVPPKSAPDDDFHLAAIWCAWGDSPYCKVQSPNSVQVPQQLIGLNCRNFDFTAPDIRCDWLSSGQLEATDRFRRSTGYNSPLFYLAQRTFVGADIAWATFKMRLANSALAAIVFGLALFLAPGPIRRAFALTWMLTCIPLVGFTIASTNPQSWAIIGGATSWIFLVSWLQGAGSSRLRQLASLAGLITTLLLAASARSDAAVFLVLSYLAVVALSWRHRRTFWRRLAVVAVPLLLVSTVGASFRLVGLLGNISSSSWSDDSSYPTEQLLSFLADLPAFYAGITGFFPASEVPWNGHVSWGLGWEGFPSPSLAFLPLTLALGGSMLWGLRSISTNRSLALAILIVPLVGLPVITVIFLNQFRSGVQLRYFLPLALVALAFVLIKPLTKREALARGQIFLLSLLAATGGTVAFASAVVRYERGLTTLWDVAWARTWAETPPPEASLWWPLVFGSLATTMFIAVLAIAVHTSQGLSSRPKLPVCASST